MDLQDKYDELQNIVTVIDNLTEEISSKYYIDCLNEVKFEVQNELTQIEEQLYIQQNKEDKQINYQYEKEVL